MPTQSNSTKQHYIGSSGVLNLIRDRSKNLKTPKNLKLALVVEGGGFKGIYTGAMLAELEASGISPSIFDFIVGSSAGSFNAAYYIAGQAQKGVCVYADHLHQNKFLNYMGWLQGRPIMNLDVLFSITSNAVPLNWRRVVNARKLYVVATEPHSSRPHLLGPATTQSELLEHVRLSAHVPYISGKLPRRAEGPLFDGSFLAPLPIEQAADLGATHVLALSTRQLNSWRSCLKSTEKIALKAVGRRYPNFEKAINDHVALNPYRVQRHLKAMTGSSSSMSLCVVDSPSTPKVRRTENRTTVLRQALEAGRESMRLILDAR